MGILFDASIHHYNTNNILGEILQEAKKDEVIDATAGTDSTDYTEEADNNTDTDDDTSDQDDDTASDDADDEPTDYTEDVVDDDSDDNTSDDETDTEEEPTDYTNELDNDDPDDSNTSDDGSGQNDDASDDASDQDPEKKKNIMLMDDIIALYYSIKSTISKLDAYTNANVVINKIIVQVKQNFSELIESVYSYTLDDFKKNSYAKNLYMYNSFIEAYKINIEMLKKIEIF